MLSIARLVQALALAGIAVLATASAGRADSIRDGIEREAKAIEARMIAWRRDIHQHPELGNREFRTAALVAEHLKKLGYEVREKVAHTGVVAVLAGGKPGRSSRLRADMDALPVTEEVDLPFASKVTATWRGQQVGVMHACGHDAHVAILMAAAEVFAKLRSELPGHREAHLPAGRGGPAARRGGRRPPDDRAGRARESRSPTRSSACTSSTFGAHRHDRLSRRAAQRRLGHVPHHREGPADPRRAALGRRRSDRRSPRRSCSACRRSRAGRST